ncbi:MAG TPA: sigma-70 family RNA polymerase sigma factor [Gemmataceae bacterium]|nr:sigma-70 family RNA polymerase sigma factor [Gemmataceae bacterium]
MESRERQAALARARQGDNKALGELLQSFRPYVQAIVRGFRDQRLQGRLDDSDMTQNAFLEAHRSFATFQGTTVAELVVWLRAIALRTAGHSVRAYLGTEMRNPTREQTVSDLSELPAASDTPSRQALQQEQASRLAEALARLPDDMQRILLGRHVDELPYAVLAEQLGRSEAALRVLYTRALKRLREEVGS